MDKPRYLKELPEEQFNAIMTFANYFTMLAMKHGEKPIDAANYSAKTCALLTFINREVLPLDFIKLMAIPADDLFSTLSEMVDHLSAETLFTPNCKFSDGYVPPFAAQKGASN